MNDVFMEREWTDLCQRLERTATYLGDKKQMTEIFRHQAEDFAISEPPQRYPQLLDKVREAAALAVTWQEYDNLENEVDEALEETFPASDPPAWTTAHV